MSATPDNPTPVPPAKPITAAGDSVAEQYLLAQIQKTRASLRRTKITGAVAALVVLGYMGFVTSTLLEYLEPKRASDMATTFISNEISEKATELAGDLKQRIPDLIQQLPDFAMHQFPVYREEIENRIEQELRQYCQTTSAQMGKHLDDYLDAHVTEIRAALKATQDREAIRLLGPDIERTIVEYLADKGDDGESIKTKIDKTLESLGRIESHLKRLAYDKDLTPQEKKTRRIIAILTRAMNDTKVNTAPEPAVTTEPALPLPKKKSPNAGAGN